MTATTAEMTVTEKALLSREINRAIEIKRQMDELGDELKSVNNRIYDMVEGEPGLYRSNRGHVEIKVSSFLTVPDHQQAALTAVLGDRYPDLVEEAIKLKAKSGLRRLVFEPGPHEREMSEQLRGILAIRTQPSFSYKGA